MKPRSSLGRFLQRFNWAAGSLHFIQALIMLMIVDDHFKIPILTRFFVFDASSPDGFGVDNQTLVNVPIAYIAPLFIFISAFFHFFIASPFYIRTYEDSIERGLNPMRWIEYSISSSLMIVALLMMGGLNELPSVVFIFTLNFIMNMMGLLMELYNQGRVMISWLPFNIGVVAGIVPWLIGGLYFWVSTDNIADAIPQWAKLGFIVTFLFFNTFAINMYLQYKKIWKWRDYSFGEKGYIVLSLTAKSALGWIVVAGTLN